ncbi:hypothetical protein [Aeromonas allosaccharophila]|nr:hypothetical protein [Aeromonas allosaccharophila]
MIEAMTEAELYAPVQHVGIAQRCAQLFAQLGAQLRSTRSEGKNHD